MAVDLSRLPTIALSVLAMTLSRSALAANSLLERWDNVKSDLSSAGVTTTISYEGDLASNLSGGARQGTTYTGNAHLQLTVDGDRTLAMPGATLFLDTLNIHGGAPDSLVGDAQGISNIAAAPDLTLYEAWLQYNFADGRASVLAGRYDLNTVFYRLASAGM
ncbi:MAG: hypothetical protein WAW96_16620, partial [Alphaproteobacteria bacterium]